MTVKDLANHFLNHKKTLLDNGELGPRTWIDYREVCDLIVTHFGKGRLVADLDPSDFAAFRKGLAKRFGPVRLGNVIQRVRSVFKLALDDGLIERFVRFGQGFARPTAKTLRLHRAKQGVKLFTPDEVCRLLDAAGHPLKALLLLGINAGFGVADSGRLNVSRPHARSWSCPTRIEPGRQRCNGKTGVTPVLRKVELFLDVANRAGDRPIITCDRPFPFSEGGGFGKGPGAPMTPPLVLLR